MTREAWPSLVNSRPCLDKFGHVELVPLGVPVLDPFDLHRVSPFSFLASAMAAAPFLSFTVEGIPHFGQ